MRLNLGKLLLAVPAIALFGSGCAPAMRMVTATHWSNGDTMYLAYAEKVGMDITPKVQKCSRQGDNKLACAEQEKINPLLVPQSK